MTAQRPDRAGNEGEDRAEFNGPTAIHTGDHGVQHNNFTVGGGSWLRDLPWGKIGITVKNTLVSLAVTAAVVFGVLWQDHHDHQIHQRKAQESTRTASIHNACHRAHQAQTQNIESNASTDSLSAHIGQYRAYAQQLGEAATASSDPALAKLLKADSADNYNFADALERQDPSGKERYSLQSGSDLRAWTDYCLHNDPSPLL
ncbi:hypothetical protein [Actinacidiphila sp. ITFR-21]|uniref:hypothetical protein n=1 Tax=Actinacidiphila sp. ITFR-21 TaxID=3075199 RepID=UPI00288B17CE|nr:hypothetical protein [Streptomyces sp. ITFR-21]WNI20227.1 hypothetical protein RLT57_32295 [Streptomyces sp. ITFR-21]